MKFKLRGTLSYPYLNAPDTKFNADGEFKGSIVTGISVANHEELTGKLEKLLADFIESVKQETGKKVRQHPDGLPFEIEEDEGTITFRFKNKVYTNKKEGHRFSHPMAFFDKDNTPLGVVKFDKDELVASDTVPSIGGGTKCIVNVEAKCWTVSGKAGISLRPVAFKLIEVVNGGGADAEDYGFDDDEDDFDAPKVSTSAPTDAPDDDEDF